MAPPSRYACARNFTRRRLSESRLGFQAFFALCLLLQISMLPDSPRWCLANGKTAEGTRILAQLEGKDTNHPDVLAKKKEIEVSLEQESAGGGYYILRSDEGPTPFQGRSNTKSYFKAVRLETSGGFAYVWELISCSSSVGKFICELLSQASTDGHVYSANMIKYTLFISVVIVV